MEQKANAGKALLIKIDGVAYERIPVKTHVITDSDKVEDVLIKYVKPVLQDGDVVFMSEKAVACTQRRAIRMKDVHPRPLAKFLSKFVLKTPYGIGLGIPETMEMALRECGTPRILFAAVISLVGKLLGRRGWFYKIAGDKARAIDGPCSYTLPPYNEYVVLGPENPEKVAREASEKSGVPLFCVVDLNDLGGNILGVSDNSIDPDHLLKILKDNPLGQSDEQTPIGIIRKASGETAARASVREWLDANRDSMIKDIRRIVAFRSVSDSGSAVKPFGQPCRDVLDEMLKICEEYGFETENFDYYCGTAFLPGTTNKEIGLWSHLDVVPDAGDWNYPALEGQIVDGFMVGRGVQDNKSAAIGGLYLMKYFRENRIPLKKGIRLFFGCSEECGMDDVRYYKNRCKKLPDYSIVADAEFPVSYGEKGIFGCNLVSPPLSGDILELSGGLVSNMVADKAYIKLKTTPERMAKLAGIEGVSSDDASIMVETIGKASHAAYPQGSVNAIDLLAKLVIEKDLVCKSDKSAFKFISNVCSDYTGAGLGVAASHREYGSLTCVGGIISLKDSRAVLNINIRYPYSEKGNIIAGVIKSRCIEYDFTVSDITDSAPSCVPQDSEFVKALSDSYTAITGRTEKPYIMGGGTYARNLPNAVAFGPEFPGGKKKPDCFSAGHGGVHEPDEVLSLNEFLTSLEIYISSVLKVDEID